MPPSSNLRVLAEPGWEERAAVLARYLGLPLLSQAPAEGQVLQVGTEGVALRTYGKKAPGPVRVDFAKGAVAHRRRFGGGRNQDIARAVGLNRNASLTIADLTAGLGRDAFVLASLGANLLLIERHPVVAALLEDGLRRAEAETSDAELVAIASRMQLLHADGAQWLRDCDERQRPDVIYLDPMFPERRKSALVKKEMAAFHDLVGRDEDAAELLQLSLQTARYRVVVKRPVGAPVLGGREPGTAISGKSTRFDIYPLQSILSPEARSSTAAGFSSK